MYVENKDKIRLLLKAYKGASKTEISRKFAQIMGIKYSDSVRRLVSWVIDNHVLKVRKVSIYDKKHKRLLITYGQNNTDPNFSFLRSMQHFCTKNDAGIVVIPGNYRNPTSKPESAKVRLEENWHDKLMPFIFWGKNLKINNNLEVLKPYTQPTAEDPLSGFESLTKGSSGIFAHPKVRLKCIPTPGSRMAKIQLTTGAVTEENYSLSKAGIKGEHHHIIGATLVEIKNNEVFYARQIIADKTGGFYDISGGACKYYNPDFKDVEGTISTYIGGDDHAPFQDSGMILERKKLIKKLGPDEIILHDLMDFYRQNHHEIDNILYNYLKTKFGVRSVKIEVQQVLKYLLDYRKYLGENISIKIVRSNHDNAFDKWLAKAHIDKLGPDLSYWHYLNYIKCESGIHLPNGEVYAPPILQTLIKNDVRFKKGFECIDYSNEFVKNEVLYSHHGDIGSNGGRGGSKNFAKYGVKTWTAHTHSPEINHGSYIVGHAGTDRVYASSGASSWMQADGITYRNGKRTLLFYIDGSFYLK